MVKAFTCIVNQVWTFTLLQVVDQEARYKISLLLTGICVCRVLRNRIQDSPPIQTFLSLNNTLQKVSSVASADDDSNKPLIITLYNRPIMSLKAHIWICEYLMTSKSHQRKAVIL